MKKISCIALALMLVAGVAEAQRANPGKTTQSRAGILRNPIKPGSPTVVATEKPAETPTTTVVTEIDINATANAEIEKAKLLELANKQALKDQLKLEISQIESEMKRCEKQKKTWTALTIAGSVGTVATGTGAIIQGVDLHKKNEKLEELQDKSK